MHHCPPLFPLRTVLPNPHDSHICGGNRGRRPRRAFVFIRSASMHSAFLRSAFLPSAAEHSVPMHSAAGYSAFLRAMGLGAGQVARCRIVQQAAVGRKARPVTRAVP